MVIDSWLVLAGLSRTELTDLVCRVPTTARRGRPHAHSLLHRVLLTCVALRTNLTLRELAVIAGIPRSTMHRIIASMTPRLAATMTSLHDRRAARVLDGTRPDTGSRSRSEIQELPLVVQRSARDPPT
jgi:hypothetical protein